LPVSFIELAEAIGKHMAVFPYQFTFGEKGQALQQRKKPGMNISCFHEYLF
jgi:hypothetical protein